MRRLEYEQKRDPNLKIPSLWTDRLIKYPYKDHLLKIYIPTNYPFHPPKIICGKTDHIGYFMRKRQYFSHICNYYEGFPCICCHSITCMWSPSMTVKHLADEYIHFYEKTRILINIYLIQKVVYINQDLWRYISSFTSISDY